MDSSCTLESYGEAGKAAAVKLNEAGYASVPFSPTADRTYAITVADSEDEADFDVYDADGEVVWDYDYAGNGAVYDLGKGTYHIVVWRSAFAKDAPVELKAVRLDPKSLPSGALGGDPIEGSITSDQPLVEYRFTPPDDQYLVLHSNGDDDVDGEISDSDGEYVCSTEELCELTGGEEYTLRVTAFDADSAGYSLAFGPESDYESDDGYDDGSDYSDYGTGIDAGTLSDGDTFSDYLSSGESVDFTVSTDDQVSVDVTDQSGYDLDIDCTTTDGDSFDDVGDAHFTVTGPGTVDVSCSFVDGESGEFSIDVYADYGD